MLCLLMSNAKAEEELAREAAQRAANKEVKLTLNTSEKKHILAIMFAVWNLGIFAAGKLYANAYAFAFGGRFTFAHACIGVSVLAFVCTIILLALDKPLRSLVEKKEDEVEA
ncbi:hypothetical protein [Baileyella intestinalis]|uniref:hypothetical protein n=1 Tax=Baileyella intestinalis TaxID=2606709 RepID=UPI0022DEB4E8|nr:hypothetical protein [Baileyella intestinalis]